MTAMTQAQEDGYVECSECGHAIEQHDTEGCEVCDCSATWTKTGIMNLRRREGLPARYSLSTLGW